MKGKLAIIIMFSIIVYLLLVTTFYLSTPFMVSWGIKSPWYLRIILFMQDVPFKLTDADGDINLNLIFINSLFWTLCLSLLLSLSAYKLNDKT